MSYVKTESFGADPNFLASEVGLITRTCLVPATSGMQDGTKKQVPAGTILPANDATAKGVLLETVDVTDGDHIGAVITSGHLLGSQLPVMPSTATITALQAQGLYFDDVGTVSAPATGGK